MYKKQQTKKQKHVINDRENKEQYIQETERVIHKRKPLHHMKKDIQMRIVETLNNRDKKQNTENKKIKTKKGTYVYAQRDRYIQVRTHTHTYENKEKTCV